jgi:hypothetical protein
MMAPYEVKLAVMMVISSAAVAMTGIVAWTIVKLRRPTAGAPGAPGASDARAAATEERLERIEQTLDALAIEAERNGEAQRFTARLLAERLGELPGRLPERAIGQRPNNTPH